MMFDERGPLVFQHATRHTCCTEASSAQIRDVRHNISVHSVHTFRLAVEHR
jgi:hypothetical protein